MEKIMKALLEAKCPMLDADVLLDIANHTPNAQIAIEKLCGLYTPYTVEELGIYKMSDGKEPVEYKLISIDEWHNKVTYEYEHYETKGYYVPNDLDPNIKLTIYNIGFFDVEDLENSKLVFIKTGKTELRKTTTSIAHWQGLRAVNALDYADTNELAYDSID